MSMILFQSNMISGESIEELVIFRVKMPSEVLLYAFMNWKNS